MSFFFLRERKEERSFSPFENGRNSRAFVDTLCSRFLTSTLQPLPPQQQTVQMGSIKFTFDGDRIRESQTPDELNLEDGDQIDAFVEQVGGGRAGDVSL